MDKSLLLLGAAGVGLFLVTRSPAATHAGSGPTIPQSQTRDEYGQPWPVGMLVRLTDGRIATVVPG